MNDHLAHKKNEYEQVSGLFTTYNDFASLLDSLHHLGFQQDDINVLMSESTHHQYFAPQESNKAPEGASLGGISGGLLGIIIGGLTLAGNIILPGTGLLVAGPLVGALSLGAVGATAGGLIGGLVGMGMPEHEAKFFEDSLKERGQILLVVHVPKARVSEIKALFERFNASRLKIHTCAVP